MFVLDNSLLNFIYIYIYIYTVHEASLVRVENYEITLLACHCLFFHRHHCREPTIMTIAVPWTSAGYLSFAADSSILATEVTCMFAIRQGVSVAFAAVIAASEPPAVAFQAKFPLTGAAVGVASSADSFLALLDVDRRHFRRHPSPESSSSFTAHCRQFSEFPGQIPANRR